MCKKMMCARVVLMVAAAALAACGGDSEEWDAPQPLEQAVASPALAPAFELQPAESPPAQPKPAVPDFTHAARMPVAPAAAAGAAAQRAPLPIAPAQSLARSRIEPAPNARAQPELQTVETPAPLPFQPVQPMRMQSNMPVRHVHAAAAERAALHDLGRGLLFQESVVLAGVVSGLQGVLELQNSFLDDERLLVTENGEFVFPKNYSKWDATGGTSYSVAVSRQPQGQHCTVSAGSGALQTHVFNIKVTCSSALVSTVAGSGEAGSADGQGRGASFNHPCGIAVDGLGDLLVADWGTRGVRKVSRDGHVAWFANAIRHATALGVDSMGAVYVAGPSHGFIRQLIPAGGHIDLHAFPANAMTAHGNGERYYVHSEGLYRYAAGRLSRLTTLGWQSSGLAAATPISFSEPEGIAADAQGNVYVAETPKHRILKITPTGAVFTLAGSGQPGADDRSGAEATFNFPAGLALDSEGSLLVADTQNHVLRKITPAGAVSTIAGKAPIPGCKDGAGGQARFLRPRGVAVGADGTVYVADTGNHMIRKIILNP